MSTALQTVVQQPDIGEKVTLFRLDTSSVGGSLLSFCQAAINNTGVVFAGVSYTPVDVEFSGFETTGVGGLPTPRMKLANTNGAFQLLVNTFGDLIGCQIQRLRTFKRFLDGQPEADPTAFYGPDTFRIERKVSENPHFIEWELSAAFDQEGKMLPGRTIVRDTCLWRYRVWDAGANAFDYSKAQCPYADAVYYNAIGGDEALPANDRCGRKLSDCKRRFGDNAILPFGGFPGAARTHNQ